MRSGRRREEVDRLKRERQGSGAQRGLYLKVLRRVQPLWVGGGGGGGEVWRGEEGGVPKTNMMMRLKCMKQTLVMFVSVSAPNCHMSFGTVLQSLYLWLVITAALTVPLPA